MDGKFSEYRQKNYTFFEQAFKELPDGIRIVDLGAGPQQFKALTVRFQVIAVDHEQFPGINVVADLNTDLPLPSNTFDAIMLSNVLEHIFNPQKLIDESFRILKPGGKFIASVPFLSKVHQAPHDYLRYTYFELFRLTSQFEKIAIEPLGTPYDVFNVTTRHFLKRLYRSNRHRGIIRRIALKLHTLLYYFLLTFFRKLYDSAIPNLDFTYGYGIIAYKPHDDKK